MHVDMFTGMYWYLPSHTYTNVIKCVHTKTISHYTLKYIHVSACMLIFPPPAKIRITYQTRPMCTCKPSGNQAPVMDAHKQMLIMSLFQSQCRCRCDECKASGHKRTCFLFYSCHVKELFWVRYRYIHI